MLYAQMAEFDRITNQTKYKDVLKKYFPLMEAVRPNFLDELCVSLTATRSWLTSCIIMKRQSMFHMRLRLLIFLLSLLFNS